MSIHSPLRQRAKRFNLRIISEELELVHEDLETEAQSREDDRRLMIINGYDPDTFSMYTNLEDFEYALNRVDYTSADEEVVIKEIKSSLPDRYATWDFDIDPYDYYDDFHSIDCYHLY